ncbi:hypothetical protein [Actinacidiphila sp. bgisy160]|uniref:hypothetical protein n=1 Tax=Actinacidiphila sp. bgisy160 TaxID=3413796 RepID=UPI003D74BDB5
MPSVTRDPSHSRPPPGCNRTGKKVTPEAAGAVLGGVPWSDDTRDDHVPGGERGRHHRKGTGATGGRG